MAIRQGNRSTQGGYAESKIDELTRQLTATGLALDFFKTTINDASLHNQQYFYIIKNIEHEAKALGLLKDNKGSSPLY